MEGKSWVVEVVDEEVRNLFRTISDEDEGWEKHSIYELPTCVTVGNPKSYRPRAISFGPYHHGNQDLRPMEAHKHRALLRFLHRTDRSLNDCIAMVNKVLDDLMDEYDSLGSEWKQHSDQFMELMIRDGCFMLELLLPRSEGWVYYATKDPIFSDHGILYMMPFIKNDMLLLENQLPMLLLTKLLSLDRGFPEDEDEDTFHALINQLIVGFFFPADMDTKWDKLGKSKHVLDVYRKVIISGADDDKRINRLPSYPDNGVPVYHGDTEDTLPSVTELHEAGIKIKKSKTKSISDISFQGGLLYGVLRLPEITVDDTTGPVFLNLIALERFHVGTGNEVTSYIAFMDGIIDTGKDVNLLKTSEVLQNAYGSDKFVANLFNSLSEDLALDPQSPLFKVRRQVNKYSKRKWNRWQGYLARTYFKNPWTIIAVIAAALIFGLTIQQTIYTTRQFYQGQPQN